MEKKNKIVAIGTSFIPHEIVIEILKKVPAKALLRLDVSRNPFAPTYQNRYSLKHIKKLRGSISFCLWNSAGHVAICNPFTKGYVSLPYQPPKGIIFPSMTCCSLGFDPITKKHKVFKTRRYNGNFRATYWIFTIGMDKTWKEISSGSKNHPMKHNSVCNNGVIYFVTFGDKKIGAFDISDEKFIRMISFPTLKFSECSPRLVEMKGQVAVLGNMNYEGKDKIVLHILSGSGETETWVKHTIKLPSEFIKPSILPLFTINLKGEIVLISSTRILPVFLYDIGRKEWRRVKNHRIYGREFLVGYILYYLLNLVESIWSLR
ncbi:hypothetical protein HAX54_021037 [Datura stramonium]|uniref:F-box associated beta-propeller type 3 domain-containing protein n=1 Tax=Datura stramonium TaxID=4076 RepID=A0ABS8UUW0_DATST|nr:hypothetical protein [Datura stramonium]